MEQSVKNTTGITLLFAHCVGAHKEQWEPTIQHIFNIQQLKDEKHRIREAWSFDRQNHGDAAVLNHEALKAHPEGASAHEWAKSIAAFARSPRMNGHRMVIVGHSAGAGTIMLSTKEFSLSEIPYATLILVEPPMLTKEVLDAHQEQRMATVEYTARVASSRRDTWETRSAALEYFKKRFPWRNWDPRAVQIFVDHGLQGSAPHVSLKCDRMHEAASYHDIKAPVEATAILGHICHTVPVHVVWGTANDMVPTSVQKSLCDASQGRAVASVTKVEGSGHLIVQEQPERLAQALCRILDTVQTSDLLCAVARIFNRVAHIPEYWLL
ncbi:hypothetical protein DXG01_015601 [Tephrocybe rancida]|nr:hypothetical protein DXG01_015601 [Tephrocybe rancida]